MQFEVQRSRTPFGDLERNNFSCTIMFLSRVCTMHRWSSRTDCGIETIAISLLSFQSDDVTGLSLSLQWTLTMSTQCNRFVQNAWKKELCSNCFKSKEEHVAIDDILRLNVEKASTNLKIDHLQLQVLKLNRTIAILLVQICTCNFYLIFFFGAYGFYERLILYTTRFPRTSKQVFNNI